MTDIDFMQEALRLAQEAAADGEVPVGAVVVWRGAIIGRGRNRRERDKSALAHAELEAIQAACQYLGGWRLWECSIYVTLEPCPMCAGAIVNARLQKLVYGARDPKAGAAGSVLNLFQYPLNHKPVLCSGLLEDASAALLQDFFRSLRSRRKNLCTGDPDINTAAQEDEERI